MAETTLKSYRTRKGTYVQLTATDGYTTYYTVYTTNSRGTTYERISTRDSSAAEAEYDYRCRND